MTRFESRSGQRPDLSRRRLYWSRADELTRTANLDPNATVMTGRLAPLLSRGSISYPAQIPYRAEVPKRREASEAPSDAYAGGE